MARTIMEMHLDRRPIRRSTAPYIEILTLPGLEKKYIVAIVEFG